MDVVGLETGGLAAVTDVAIAGAAVGTLSLSQRVDDYAAATVATRESRLTNTCVLSIPTDSRTEVKRLDFTIMTL